MDNKTILGTVNKTDINDMIFDFIYEMAMNDATMQKAYDGSIKELLDEKPARTQIKSYIESIFNGESPDFYNVVKSIEKEFENYRDFTFGNIQKLINMTAKYFYISSYHDASKRVLFKCCHCPMDSKMIYRVSSRYKELIKDKPELKKDNIEYFNTNNCKSGESCDWSKISWSKICFDGEGANSINVYKQYQDMVSILATELGKIKNEEILPLEYDYIMWGTNH